MQGSGLLVILFFFGLAGGVVGRMKGSSFFIWFLISAAVPFLGLLARGALSLGQPRAAPPVPGCARVVMLHDAVCTNCGYELEFPDVAIASESALAGRVARAR